MSAKFSAAQYSGALRSLLPRGKAWNIEDGSVQASLCDGLTQVYEQSDSDAIQLLADAFPATANAMLPEWNASVGIPDACFGAPSNRAQNIQQLLAKLTGSGGQSVPYFKALAATLGINITVSEFSATYTASDVPAGMITKPADWSYTFRVNVDRNSMSPMTVGSCVNAYLATQNMKPMNCLLRRYKPAHTQFYYGFFSSTPTRLFNAGDTVNKPLSIPL